jgi:MFS family permease
MIVGLTLFAVAAVTYSFATSVGHLILVRLVHGTGSAMIVPMAMALMADFAPEGKEGRYMGILNVAIFAGIGSGPVIGGVFLDLWGIDSAFYAMAILSLLAMVLVVTRIPSTDTNTARAQKNALSTLKMMLKRRRVSGILLSRLATMVIMSPTFGFVPILMSRDFDASGMEIGAVVATRTLANALFQSPFGRLADRRNKVVIVAAGSLAMAVIVFCVPFAASFMQFLILFLLLGLSEAVVLPALGAFAVEEGREFGQGPMMGVFSMSMSLGVLVGSMVGGLLMDLLGLKFAFYGVAVLLAGSTAAACWLIISGQKQVKVALAKL